MEERCEKDKLVEEITQKISSEISNFLQTQVPYKNNIDILKTEIVKLQNEFSGLLVRINSTDDSHQFDMLKGEYFKLITEMTKVNSKLKFYEKELTTRFYGLDKTIRKSFETSNEVKNDIIRIGEDIKENKTAVEFITKKTLGEPYDIANKITPDSPLRQRLDVIEASIDIINTRLTEAELVIMQLRSNSSLKKGLTKLSKPVKSVAVRILGHVVIRVLIYVSVILGLSPKFVEFIESIKPYFE